LRTVPDPWFRYTVKHFVRNKIWTIMAHASEFPEHRQCPVYCFIIPLQVDECSIVL
jgi:hypothetical protein